VLHVAGLEVVDGVLVANRDVSPRPLQDWPQL
jgi:hypothetical protein